LVHHHHAVHMPHPEEEDELSKHDWIEIAAAVLLALATIASAWSAYQSARWSGLEARKFNEANANRIYASERYDLADQQYGIDVEMFIEYLKSFVAGDMELVSYFETDLFSEELKEAMEAWKATEPLNNPEAPVSPFDMEEYRLEARAEAEQFEAEAREAANTAGEAIETSDLYILFTVLFASVLFFAGISTKFKRKKIRIAVICMGGLIFLISVILVSLRPIH
jgi:hypothetical protein